MNCVNRNSKQFKELVKDTGLSPLELEMIVHKMQNERGVDYFPTIEEINNLIKPKSFEGSKKSIELWEHLDKETHVFPTIDKANKFANEYKEIFGNDSVKVFQMNNGTFEVKIGEPIGYERKLINDLKPQYRGKLIYAQSGTGKSVLADNKTVFDSDYILGEVLGTSAETAGFFFGQLSKEQKKVFGKKYREAIREKINQGYTVVTANNSLMNEADTIVYNSSIEQTNERTNSKDRAITNQFVNSKYQKETFDKINKEKNENSQKEFIELSKEQYLSDVLLSDSSKLSNDTINKNLNKRKEQSDVLTKEKLISDFLKEFGFTVNDISNYDGELPLFDALSRAINAKDSSEITDGVGEAIAFMMQSDPEMQRLIVTSHLGMKGDFNKRLPIINRTIKNLHPNQNSPIAKEVIKEVGKMIADELRKHFNEEVKTKNSIWTIIKNFFKKIGMSIVAAGKRGEVIKGENLFVRDIIDALGREDFSRIKGPLIKSGTLEKAEQVDIEKALKEHPFEENIVSIMSKAGISLAGSASIALQGSLYRPSENPLHDLDFNTKDGTKKEDLDKLLPTLFPKDTIHYSSIIQRKDGSGCVTYLYLNQPYVIKNRSKTGYVAEYYSKDGKYLGRKEGSELYLEKGVQGKLLDFFIDDVTEKKYGFYNKEINGKKYLLTNSKAAFAAKILWARPKDIWDYKNFNPNESYFNNTIDNFEDINYNGETKSELLSKIIDKTKEIQKKIDAVENVISLMDIAKRDYEYLPLKRKVGALRRKVGAFNKEYNTNLRVDDNGNVISNINELHNKLLQLQDSSLADKIINNWHYEQATLRQNDIDANLELLGRDDYFENKEDYDVEQRRALYALNEEGIKLDNSLIDDFLNESRDSNPYHQVFKQIVSILNNNNIPIKVVVDTNLQAIAARRQDGFETATIRFNPSLLLRYLNYFPKDEIKGRIRRIITHELVHAVTAEVLDTHPSFAKEAGFDKAQTEFNEKVWKLYENCKEQLKETEWYGLKDVKEFIAEALTNRDFQIELSKIEIKKKKKNIFQTFVNYITDLFNKIFKAQGISINNTALEEAITISEEYFEYANKNINKEIFSSNNTDNFESTSEQENKKTDDNKINLTDVDENGKPLWIEKTLDLLPTQLWLKLYKEYGNQFKLRKEKVEEITKQDKEDFDYYANFLPSFMKKVKNNLKILQKYKQEFEMNPNDTMYRIMKDNEARAAYDIIYERIKTRENYFKANADAEYVDREDLNGALARTGVNKIRIAKDITMQEFFDYITGKNAYDEDGKILNQTSVQKMKVFDELAKQGYTKEFLEQLIETDEDARKLIFYHELSHLYWRDMAKYFESDYRDQNNKLVPYAIDMYSPTKIYIEARATADAIERLKEEKIREANNSNKSKKEQDTYTEKQNKKVKQLQTLYNSDILKATEVRHIADQVVYWISDFITTVQTTPNSAESISNLFNQEYKTEDGKNIDFSTMSRADIVRTIGVDNIIELAKRNFDPKQNEYDDFDTADKAEEIIENWDAIMLLAQDTFLRIENFSIVQTEDGKAQEINDEIKAVDDFNQSNEESTVAEEEGNQQEHWQVEQRCMDVIESMSQLVKRALLQCYKIDKDGNVEQSEFGINERIEIREATNSILRFCQGATNMSQMIAHLKENMADNPWLQQIIIRLEDKSGANTDFQSQFYGAFNKYFQPYSVIIKQNNKWVSIPVNVDTAVNEAITQIQTQYKIGESPLFTLNGISKESYNSLIESIDKLIPYYRDLNNILNDVNKEEICNILGYISNLFGYYVTPDIVERGLNANNFKEMYNALYYIKQSVEKHLNDSTYDPFDFKSGIKGNLKRFLNPFVSKLNDLKIDAFYSNGNMYQSYTLPSYMTKLMQKFKLKGEDFNNFLNEQYGKYDWFNQNGEWRNSWLEMLSKDEKAREIFDHKVQLNFNGSTYMKDMDDMTYTLSLITEYFSVNSSDKQSLVPAWFRVPIMSNKPSSEFIKFYSYRGSFYKESIIKGMMNIFNQELSRIQTVLMRNYDKSDPRYITNFDKNGKQFCFLPNLNEYLNGEKTNTELGKLLKDKLDGKLNENQETKLYELVSEELTNMIQERSDKILKEWEENGILKSSEKIQGLNQNTREKLENFIWNDAFAAMNIMQLTISDIAFYKNTEDLQKRLAQLHAPGIKPNIDATDYNGIKVSDGKERTIYITDLENVISDVIDNISIIFDRKIANAKTEEEKKGYEILKENLVGENGAYRKINVTDGQGYSSITSYRKKALLFGKWSTQAEEMYQKIRRGEYHYDDLQVMLQPLKPFVYSQIEKSSDKINAPLKNLGVPIQNKNSEYLLILADAIMQGEGQSNLLSSIYEVMEESHYDENGKYKADGIDTVQFASAVKSGLTGAIDINDCINMENGAKVAKEKLQQTIYKHRNKTVKAGDKTYTVNRQLNAYNDTFVHTIPFEDYSLQQEIPKHFMEHEQLIGSQIRYLIISNLESVNSFGEETKFKVKDQEYNVDELKKEYEKLNAENIEDSIQNLIDELKLNALNKKERNETLSKILQREILSSPRYGIDMLIACSLDENGDFKIPLGDPIQSKRIEQLLNSIIKNRINKQEIKGGPVVQVSPFGTSQKLHIRFKDKQGNLLQTKDEYKGEKSYEEYLKENQDGVAYFEVFAPISSKKLFSQFADRNGNINIQAIEEANPDLLKIIGYRIPTEAKYSMIPMKIVGFLPREAGETIMMPEEITTTTGSDFDKFMLK